jgi:uncharacterized protein (DUF1684 family)
MEWIHHSRLTVCALMLVWLLPARAEITGSDPRSAAPESDPAADYLARLARYRDNANFRFRDRILSPLTEADRLAFSGLEFFDPAPDLALPARFEPAADQSVFAMPTYDRRTLRYSHQGTLTVKLHGSPLRLKAFRRQEEGGRRNFLLVPFRDATNAGETYAGGRYIELSLPLPAVPVLDFNRAQNPLCAYDPSYACPIPPRENHLPMPIQAGEKRYRIFTPSP